MKLKKMTSTFVAILREYLSRSQVQGYNLIVQTDRPWHERVLWIIITIIGVVLTFWLVMNSYFDYLVSPTVTSEDPLQKSVLKLSFPAVTICNSNRISRRALIKFSRFILNGTRYEDENIGRSVPEIFKTLLLMGQMYTMELSENDFYEVEMIHNVLTKVYGGTYPIYEILSQLAPNCTEMLKACKWQGRSVPCSNIFATRKSYMGPCCSFNYQRPVNSILKTQQQFNQTIPILDRPRQVNSHGSDFGLAVLLDQQLNDYAFTINSFTGVIVLIHSAYDYPDQISGSSKGKIISPHQEVSLTLNPTLIQGSKSMRTFTIGSRNCVFDDEINLVFTNFYSLSECLLTCRITNIIQFCGCTPPQFTNLFNSTACMFSDLPCLNHWRNNWYDSEPISKVGRNEDINDYHCPECVPKCNRIKYSLHSSESEFDPQETKERSHDPNFINFTNVVNHSIIYVYFGTNKAVNYDQTASYVWYELLANLGAVGGLSLGATMVSIIEIFYFFSGKLGAIWMRDHCYRKSQFDYVN